LTALVAAVVAAYFGGWEWALLLLLASALSWKSGMFSTLAPTLCWLALFHWSGDRRLYFPFAMQFAVQAPYLQESRWASWALVAIFLIIRVFQAATAGVLALELVVAIAILIFMHALRERIHSRVLAGAIGSLLAFGGLAF